MGSCSDKLWGDIQGHIAVLETEGKITATFRRLDIGKQKQIVMAILEALADRPHGINIKEIAAEAGVSVGSMYQYFPNRDAMVSFAVILTSRSVVDSFKSFELYLNALPLRESLVAYLEGGIAWSQEWLPFLRLFARCAYHGDSLFRDDLVVPISFAMREMVTAILTAAAARGELRPDVDIDGTARLINGFFIAVADTILLPHLNHYFQIFPSDRKMDIKTQLLGAVDFVLRSIENRGA